MAEVNDLAHLKVRHREAIDLAHESGDFAIRKFYLETAAKYAKQIAARELRNS